MQQAAACCKPLPVVSKQCCSPSIRSHRGPGFESDRRTFFLSWAATLVLPRLQPSSPPASSPEPLAVSRPVPLHSLSYLDASICVSAAYPASFYTSKLQSSETLARQQLGDLLEAEAYSQLSNSLILEDFNDMRQAAFYLPCALAHESMELANQAQADYLAFLKQCRNLDSTARAAANARTDHEAVEEAMAMVWQAADEMLRIAQLQHSA